jgi:putative phage-type endonuclease
VGRRVELIQRTENWKEWRGGAFLPPHISPRFTIGGSSAPIVCGISPYKSPKSLAREKLTGRENTFITEQMRKGMEIEGPMRLYILEKFERDMVVEACYEREDYPRIIASLDAIDELENLYEIKYSENEHILQAYILDENPPLFHVVQLAHQVLVVHEKPNCAQSFIVFTDGVDVYPYEIVFSQEMLDKLLEHELWFCDNILDIAEGIVNVEPRGFAGMYSVRKVA